MDILKKIWPGAFNVSKNDTKKFVITIVAYIVIGFLAGVVAGILGWILPIPFVGWLFGTLASVVDLYCFVGLILSILVYVEVLKVNGKTTVEEPATEEESANEENADNE